MTAKAVWDTETAEDIAANALQILAKTSNRKTAFFNGKVPKCILKELFYILEYRFCQETKEKKMAVKVGATQVLVKKPCKLWLTDFPNLFTDVTVEMKNMNKNLKTQNRPMKKFDEILLESKVEIFSCTGENVKKAIYLHLENFFNIPKKEIASRVDGFSDTLYLLLASKARWLEVLIKLHKKTCCQYEWEDTEWQVPDLAFSKRVTKNRFTDQENREIGELEVTVYAKGKQES